MQCLSLVCNKSSWKCQLSLKWGFPPFLRNREKMSYSVLPGGLVERVSTVDATAAVRFGCIFTVETEPATGVGKGPFSRDCKPEGNLTAETMPVLFHF